MRTRHLALTTVVAVSLLLIVSLSAAVEYGSAALDGEGYASREMPLHSNLVLQTTTLPYTTAVEAVPAEPWTLDPGLDYDAAGVHVLHQIYETLITFERERADVFVPLLATGWNLSPDGRTYTFTLRSGLTFHDGAALTPQDVAYTLRRNLLTGAGDSPQWLFNQAFFNLHDVTELIAPDGSLRDDPVALQAQPPELLYAACTTVTNAIAFDDAAGTVTFHLVHPWNAFLTTLAEWGWVMDRDWALTNGAWDGDCATWQNFYATLPPSSTLATIANGTGPFILEHWTPGVEITLQRNPAYWRTTPLWPGAPTGPAALERVLLQTVPDAGARAAMLLAGQADLAPVTGYEAALANHVLLRYDEGVTETLQVITGTLNAFAGLPVAQAYDGFFTYDIAPGGTHNYTGTGALDGQGIPVDFFTDIHVRKAFNYAFDWDHYVELAYGGQGIRRTGPIIRGLIGYNENQPTYFYSPTLALQELSLAWNGQVISSGFVFTVSYNTGSLRRQAFAETLETGIEALSPAFQVHVLELPWNEFYYDFHNAHTPIFCTGWIQDIPHPHNWIDPYLLSTYANFQRLPDPQRATFEAQAPVCLALSGNAARSCYENIQATAHLSATDLFLAQGTETRFVRVELRGYYPNTLQNRQTSFYDLSKATPPVIAPVAPGEPQILDFSSTLGTTGTVALPASAVTQTLDLVLTPDTAPGSVPGSTPAGFALSQLGFTLQAFSGGIPLRDFTFNTPVTITLHYNPQTIGWLLESELRLFRWNGAAYEDAACGPVLRDPEHDLLQVPICHLSAFALGGVPWHTIHLPLLLRQ